jgi:glycosyltransferase involved in cell wall biosynthesis
MHVAHFVHRYPPAVGGAEKYVERLSRFLVARGDTVTVWTSTAVELEEMWYSSSLPARCASEGERNHRSRFGLVSLAQPAVRRYRPLCFLGRRYVLKALSLLPVPPLQALTLPCNPVCPRMWRDAGRYAGPLDAVHAFAFPYAFPAMCGLRLARRRGVPFLLTPFLHLGDPDEPTNRTRRQYTSAPLRWLLHQADGVFVQTLSEFRAVAELGVAEDRIILQGLGVDAADCTGGNRDAARRAWGIAPGEVVIGHLANLSAEKGTLDLLRATPGMRVVLAGPDMPNFRRFWDDFPAKDRVTRLGRLTEEQKRDFFAGIDIFALPSRTDSFGLVLLEAWANGKPNVCYRAGGPADLVRDGEDGFLVKCGDVTELRDRIECLVNDAALRHRLGEAGRARTADEFRWADKLERIRLHAGTPISRDWPQKGTKRHKNRRHKTASN